MELCCVCLACALCLLLCACAWFVLGAWHLVLCHVCLVLGGTILSRSLPRGFHPLGRCNSHTLQTLKFEILGCITICGSQISMSEAKQVSKSTFTIPKAQPKLRLRLVGHQMAIVGGSRLEKGLAGHESCCTRNRSAFMILLHS